MVKLRFNGVIKEVIRSDKMSDKLLPCPFCGGEAKALTRSDGYEFTEYVMCGNCEAESGWFKTKDEAITAWNTRIPVKLVIGRLIDEGVPFPSEDYDIGYSDGLSCAIKIVKEEM